ncbi:hypothetical protein AB434_1848 [Heyndrickxia coagulans]|uniref:Uncharacterized protein n=1 Tax=Heyndrickxia coagulans TaxID=1398 RepID=A0AAN0T7J5_HEYCO|nr:hypothetical protein SB48_HM08orf05564 [Heyndrickxia coagulans]AKN54253.1 hypothetical protein AB434_1848 [Heyndrickxia coagulans]KYC60402.1 hypothetical protein B4100_0815 [Heyndrickxia coagulans]KYC85487.1 hypothetical protein B4096_0782 [Heyndrickxia coagulans]
MQALPQSIVAKASEDLPGFFNSFGQPDCKKESRSRHAGQLLDFYHLAVSIFRRV